MSKLRCHISISLDGFVAGPNQSEENPLGEGGERLHDWVVPLAAWRQPHGKQGGEVNESARIVEESRENIGAAVMGRNMFGPVGGGAWGDEQWTGWWGDNPPYHYPVFILTHYPRWGSPFNRSSMARWPDPAAACTTRGRWASSRRGFAPMPTVLTTWSGCAGHGGSCARDAAPAEVGGSAMAASCARLVATGPR